MATNLPSKVIEDSAAGTKLFFDRYGEAPMEFSSMDVDLAHSFFERAGFGHDAASTVAMTLLRQAKIEGIPVGKILDSLVTYNGVQLSQLVGEILNNNRVSTSILGFRTTNVKTNQTRNIAA